MRTVHHRLILRDPMAYHVHSFLPIQGRSIRVGENAYHAADAVTKGTEQGQALANHLVERLGSPDAKTRSAANTALLGLRAAMAVQKVQTDPAAVRRVEYLAGKGHPQCIAICTGLFANKIAAVKRAALHLVQGCQAGDDACQRRAIAICKRALQGDDEAMLAAKALRDTMESMPLVHVAPYALLDPQEESGGYAERPGLV